MTFLYIILGIFGVLAVLCIGIIAFGWFLLPFVIRDIRDNSKKQTEETRRLTNEVENLNKILKEKL